MPRRRPAQLRASPTRAAASADDLGLAAVTAEALERLDQPGLEPETVAGELRAWRQVVGQPARTLAAPHNDWVEFIGPAARSVLEDAVGSISRQAGAPLRAELARLDADFERKTSHNPLADPTLPWWLRRWSH